MEYSVDNLFDVIVVGAGIMGSCAAYEIAKRGFRVLLLEQFDFLHHRGSSHGESRTIRATYPEPYYPPLVMKSISLWEQAESESGYKVYFQSPQLDVGPVNNKSLQAVIQNCRLHSIRHRVLDATQVHQEFAGLIRLPDNWIGVVSEVGGVVKPTKAVSMFQALALKRGAVLKDNMEVKSIERDEGGGRIVVSTADGQNFWCQKCVVTAGAWTSKLVRSNKSLATELPIKPLETAAFYWRIKEGYENEFTIGGGFPSFASYGHPYLYGTPSLEFPGLFKIGFHGGRACDPDQRSWAVSPAAVESVKEWIKQIMGDRVDSSGPVMTQSCMYSMTPDEDFVIDFLGGDWGKSVVVAGGFSGHGFKMGPVVGRMVADLVLTGEAKGVDLRHYRVTRFEGNPKGNVKDFEKQVSSGSNQQH
ncbi:hypothetical protein NMG60_11000656 [Bertholletia excelsa]